MYLCVGEASYLESYYYFITTKESLDLLFLKFLFLGPPRLGKTTVRRRLLKEIVDLLSAGEANLSQPSTGTVESSDVVVSNVSSTTAVITESDWSALTGHKEEARMLMNSLIHTMRSIRLSATPNAKVNETAASGGINNSPSEPSLSSSSSADESYEELPAALLPGAINIEQEVKLPQQISAVSTFVRDAMGSESWKYVKTMYKALLRMEDTGGQPELMDMLPALTLGPGLYLLFINLQNDLDHHYKLTYCNASGENTPPIKSVYSVKEMLLSSLSSISCSNACSPVSKLKTSVPEMEDMLKSSKSVAYIVGTHKDKVSDEHIKKLNEELKKMIIPTQFYKQDIIQFATEEDLIVTMDNMAGGAEEVHKVKKLFEDSMARHFKKLRIPAVWLFFSLILRHQVNRTASLDYCMELSNSLGMSTSETQVALWFLHHHAGVLMYFPNVPELEDLIIIDVQIVYDSVTNLILQAMSFDKVGHSDAEEFKKNGKFTLSRIISSTREVSGDHIPIKKLIILLEFLHIIATIPSHQPHSASPSSSVEVTYMMPCILRNASIDKLDSIEKMPEDISPMLFHFKCGSVPIGVFPALMACLISNTSFLLIQDETYKNMVRFRFGDFCTLITLVCYPTYYECILSEFSSNQVEPHTECASITRAIESILSVVSSRVNYGSFVDYEFAFDCPLHPAMGREHLCVLDRTKTSAGIMLCLCSAGNPQPVKAPTNVLVWFGKVR